MPHNGYKKCKFQCTQIKVDWGITQQKISTETHHPLFPQSNILALEYKLLILQAGKPCGFGGVHSSTEEWISNKSLILLH